MFFFSNSREFETPPTGGWGKTYISLKTLAGMVDFAFGGFGLCSRVFNPPFSRLLTRLDTRSADLGFGYSKSSYFIVYLGLGDSESSYFICIWGSGTAKASVLWWILGSGGAGYVYDFPIRGPYKGPVVPFKALERDGLELA